MHDAHLKRSSAGLVVVASALIALAVPAWAGFGRAKVVAVRQTKHCLVQAAAPGSEALSNSGGGLFSAALVDALATAGRTPAESLGAERLIQVIKEGVTKRSAGQQKADASCPDNLAVVDVAGGKAKWALGRTSVVAVALNSYIGQPKICPDCGRDLTQVVKTLAGLGGDALRAVTLIDETATRDAIIDALWAALHDPGVETVIFYFAGLGDVDALWAYGKLEGAALHKTALHRQTLRKLLEDTEAKRVLAFTDSKLSWREVASAPADAAPVRSR